MENSPHARASSSYELPVPRLIARAVSPFVRHAEALSPTSSEVCPAATIIITLTRYRGESLLAGKEPNLTSIDNSVSIPQSLKNSTAGT